MEQQFRDDYRDTPPATIGRFRFLFLAFLDVFRTAPVELARELRMDLSFACRVYRRRALTAILAVAALSLTIGASTAVFSVLNALLLRQLPFANPERLVQIQGGPVGPFQGRAIFRDWVRGATQFEEVAVFTPSEMNLALGNDALRVKVAETSANFFDVFGTRFSGGRGFKESEDVPATEHGVVISYALWQEAFAGSYQTLGSTVRLNGKPLQVIGIAAPLFDYPAKTQIWVSSVYDFEVIPKQGAFMVNTVARFSPVTSVDAIRHMMPKATVTPLRDQLAGKVQGKVWVLCGIVFLVLLAACANIAQLLLSRTSERLWEFATREALGASRGRLIQQLVTEALLLTIAGLTTGMLVAYWCSRIAASVAPPEILSQNYTLLDWRVLGFAMALATLTTLLFGLLPAWVAGRKPGPRARNILLGTQAAVTLTLLALSFVMSQTFLRLLDTDLGFRKDHVLSMTVSLQGSGARPWTYYNEALQRLNRLHGVEAAGGVRYLPLVSEMYMAGSLQFDGQQQKVGSVLFNSATTGYFSAIGSQILAGRDFQPHEGEPTVIVNDAFLRSASVPANSEVVGRKLIAPWSKKPYTIVGVVESARLAGPEHATHPQVFWPVEEEPGPLLTFVIRTTPNANAAAALAAARDTLRGIDPRVPVFDVQTIEDRLRAVLAQPRFFTTAILFFGALALLLSLIGIYGAVAQSVAQRRREMGIRIALGASTTGVRNLLIRDGLLPIAIGSAAGIAASIWTSQYLAHLVEGVNPIDFKTCVFSALGLSAAALISAWTASLGLWRIDPITALRSE
jgi:putative ABC transport system permease protein